MSKDYIYQALEQAQEALTEIGEPLTPVQRAVLRVHLVERIRNALCIPGGPVVEAAVSLILMKLIGKPMGHGETKKESEDVPA